MLPRLASTALVLVLAAAAACAQPAAEPTADAATPSLTQDPELAARYAATITAEDLAAYLYVLASDHFEGRETGTRGQKLAALYLAGQYRKLGLAPKGTAETDDPFAPEAYFQPFALAETRVARATLRATAAGRTLAEATYGLEERDGRAYIQYGREGEAEGGLVFAGYGITGERLDEVAALREAGLSLEGRWVLLLGDEPLDAEGRSLITPDGEPSAYSGSWFRKVIGLLQAGLGQPAGFLVVADRSPLEELTVAERAEAVPHILGALSRPGSGGASFSDRLPPVFHVAARFADGLLAPAGRSVDALQQQIDRVLEPEVFEIEGVSLTGSVEKETREIITENVLAFIEGTDLRDEVVVLSAHYDHEGIDPLATGDNIYNGADDDGSGTVTLLEIAEAFMKAKADGHGPRRSILFASFTGEEKGLLGSAHYTDVEPVLPLEKTVANFNIDMIGRYDPEREGSTDYVYLIGSKIVSEDLDRISIEVNDLLETGLTLDDRFNTPDDPNRFYQRSDHWNFGKHRIPFIFYFTGTHEDYHGVGDEPHKIDYERMARIAQLIFGTVWEVANQDERPQISGEGFW